MQTIRPSLLILIALAFLAGSCGGKESPVKPVEPPAASHAVAVATNTQQGRTEYEPFVHDSLRVSFEGTVIRMLNTSGGTRLVDHEKQIIFEIDWKVQAWNPDSTEVNLVAISNRSEWHPVKGTISGMLFYVYCEQWPDKVWQGPRVGYNSGFSDELLASPLYRNAFEDDKWQLLRCSPGKLRARIVGGRNWSLTHNVFHISESVTIEPLIRAQITYHPIVSDSSYIESETAWLKVVLEDRQGFRESVEKMLPISIGNVALGGPLVVPPDTTTTGYYEDEAFIRAAERLRAEYPNGVGYGNYFRFRTGIMSERMARTYGHARLASRGRGFVGEPWSVFLYEKKVDFSFKEEIMAHEIGHNLGLIHTEDDPSYPGYPSEMNKDAFFVESDFVHEVHRLLPHRTRPLMYNGFGNVRRWWLSEYNWNNALDFIQEQTNRPVAARSVVRYQSMLWTCNGQH